MQTGVSRVHVALTQPVEREARLCHPTESHGLLVGLLHAWIALQPSRLPELVPGVAGDRMPVDGQVLARLVKLGCRLRPVSAQAHQQRAVDSAVSEVCAAEAGQLSEPVVEGD